MRWLLVCAVWFCFGPLHAWVRAAGPAFYPPSEWGVRPVQWNAEWNRVWTALRPNANANANDSRSGEDVRDYQQCVLEDDARAGRTTVCYGQLWQGVAWVIHAQCTLRMRTRCCPPGVVECGEWGPWTAATPYGDDALAWQPARVQLMDFVPRDCQSPVRPPAPANGTMAWYARMEAEMRCDRVPNTYVYTGWNLAPRQPEWAAPCRTLFPPHASITLRSERSACVAYLDLQWPSSAPTEPSRSPSRDWWIRMPDGVLRSVQSPSSAPLVHPLYHLLPTDALHWEWIPPDVDAAMYRGCPRSWSRIALSPQSDLRRPPAWPLPCLQVWCRTGPSRALTTGLPVPPWCAVLPDGNRTVNGSVYLPLSAAPLSTPAAVPGAFPSACAQDGPGGCASSAESGRGAGEPTPMDVLSQAVLVGVLSAMHWLFVLLVDSGTGNAYPAVLSMIAVAQTWTPLLLWKYVWPPLWAAVPTVALLFLVLPAGWRAMCASRCRGTSYRMPRTAKGTLHARIYTVALLCLFVLLWAVRWTQSL